MIQVAEHSGPPPELFGARSASAARAAVGLRPGRAATWLTSTARSACFEEALEGQVVSPRGHRTGPAAAELTWD